MKEGAGSMIKAFFNVCLITISLFFTVPCYAQQQPMFTQYMFNGLVLNPAYAGSQETFTATALLRKQWVGIEDAPQTQTFSAHSPLDNLRNNRRPDSKVSLGLTLFNDRIAITDQTSVLASYAYRLKLKNNANLSLGLQAGFSQFRIKYSQLALDDPSFSIGDIAEWQPDFGAGVYYQAERFYTGFSAPQMLRTNRNQNHSSRSVVPHYFLTMGYVFDRGHAFKLKPNVLIKSIKGNLFQLDINCNFFLYEIVNLGISWRSFESVGSMIQFQVHQRFVIGYAYDIPYGSELSRLSNGSHEIMVNYSVPNKKQRTVSPRFF